MWKLAQSNRQDAFHSIKTTDKMKEVTTFFAFRSSTVENGVKEVKASMKRKTFALSRR